MKNSRCIQEAIIVHLEYFENDAWVKNDYLTIPKYSSVLMHFGV